MNGHKFEHKCAKMLRRMGYHHVEVTRQSGDQGVDVIAYRGFLKYAVQCKYYSYPVGNKAVQEVFAGAKYYDCDRCIVMTNNTFTKAARSAAKKLEVELWENCSVPKSGGLVYRILSLLNIVSLLMGLVLLQKEGLAAPAQLLNYPDVICVILAGICGWLGFGSLVASTFAACAYFLAGWIVDAPSVALPKIGEINILFFVMAAIYLVHLYFMRPKKGAIPNE